MKNAVKIITALTLLLTAPLHPHTNKTSRVPRPCGVNLAHERVLFQEMIDDRSSDRLGGHFQLAPLYTESLMAKGLGQYFGISNKSSFVGGFDATQDINLSMMIHDAQIALNPNGHNNTISLRPTQRAFGLLINYHQDLDAIKPGIYIKLQTPLVRVINNLNLQITGPDSGVIAQYLQGNLAVLQSGRGPISGLANNGSQVPLARAKIKGTMTATGPADVDVICGYAFVRRQNFRFALNAALTIPTGNENDGIYAYNPLYGNGNHVGLGGGYDLTARLWGDSKRGLVLSSAANYRYLFMETEERTLGSRRSNQPAATSNWSQYFLLGDLNAKYVDGRPATVAQQQFIPAANVLTRSVDIELACQLEAIVGLSYLWRGLMADIGYNIYYRSRERIRLRDAWDDTAYVFVSPQAITNGGGNAATISAGPVTTANLDLQAAATPAQLTHKLYGALGYRFDVRYPFFIGAGGHYEVSQNNAASTNWEMFFKGGISF